MIVPSLCIKSFVIGIASLVSVQALWALMSRPVSAQTYTNPAPQGLVPYGESGVFKTGPNGITVIVPEGLRLGAVAPGSDFTPQGLAQQAGQAAQNSSSSSPGLTCNCQCPASSSQSAGQSVGTQDSLASVPSQDGNAISESNDASSRSHLQSSRQRNQQQAGQVAPASALYGPPTRTQDESGAEASYEQERNDLSWGGQGRTH